MFKNFFKNHKIHKKIVPYLDSFFILNPLVFFNYWMIICLGMYIPFYLEKTSPLFLTDFNYKLYFMFVGFSMLLSVLNLRKKMLHPHTDNRNSIEFVTKENINKMIYSLLILGLFFLLLSGWIYLLLGLVLVLNSLFLFWIINKKILSFFSLEINLILILFTSGYIYTSEIINTIFFQFETILILIPYIVIYTSIYLVVKMLDCLSDSKNLFKSVNNRIVLFLLVTSMLISLILAIKLNDPLSSICICSSLPFFLYAFLRHSKKDFQRAFFYPLFIVNFFVVTIFPFLAIPALILFWLSKYYNWHRFDYHFPTFLVEND